MRRRAHEIKRRGPSPLLGKAAKYREPNRELAPEIHALRKRRYDLGLSLPALALKMDYDPLTVAGWECGSRTPSLVSLRKWCEALEMRLNVTPEELLS